jgi:hypothetical protein
VFRVGDVVHVQGGGSADDVTVAKSTTLDVTYYSACP